MILFSICRRHAPAVGLCAMGWALLITLGCRPANPPAPAKSKVESVATNAFLGSSTNSTNTSLSVFEELPPAVGKDPFYPVSHRRDPVPSVSSELVARVDPDLTLRAVLRNKHHSQAVINNEILETGEQESVRVPTGHVLVRCLEIGNDYVVVQVEGEAESKRLTMDKKKN